MHSFPQTTTFPAEPLSMTTCERRFPDAHLTPLISETPVPKRLPRLFQVSVPTGVPRVQLVVLRHRGHVQTHSSCCGVLRRFVLVAVGVDVGQGAGTGS